jgi:hypothetical protein
MCGCINKTKKVESRPGSLSKSITEPDLRGREIMTYKVKKPRSGRRHIVQVAGRPTQKRWQLMAAWNLWKAWKAWGDNPLVVLLATTMSVIALITFLTGKASLPTLLQDESKASPYKRPISNPPAATDPGIRVVPPTWLVVNHTLLLFDNQVLVKSTAVTDESASFRIEIPDQEASYWSEMPVGTRRIFSYRESTYFFTLLQVKDGVAELVIDKKLP